MGTVDGQVVILDGGEPRPFIGHRRRITRIVPLPHGFITGCEDGTLRVWLDEQDGPTPVVDLGAPITDVLARPDGTVAVATTGGVVVLDRHVRVVRHTAVTAVGTT